MMTISTRFPGGDILRYVLSRLKQVHGKNGQYIACCPAHVDRSPSLSISCNTGDGRLLIHCFAGCSINAICDALDISLSDLFPKRDSARDCYNPLSDWKRRQYEDVLRQLVFCISMFENAVRNGVPMTERDIEDYLLSQTRRRKVEEALRHG